MTFRERLRELILIPASYVGAPAFAQTGNRSKMLQVKHFGTIDVVMSQFEFLLPTDAVEKLLAVSSK